MAFRVRLADRAYDDLDDILEWLGENHIGRPGIEWYLALEDSIASLTKMPQRCSIAQESIGSGPELRQLLYGNPPHTYRVLFEIVGTEVHVLRVRHSRRNWIS